MRGQSNSSFVPSVVKTEVLLDCDDLAHKDLLLQQYGERIEKLSQQDKLRKFCMDAGFLTVVEIGHYFMTKDTAEFSQFRAVACREYNLPRDEEASQPKGWIQGNTKIRAVLEIATCCLHGKYGVEIRIMSVNRDNSHSWVRISHGSNKFVMNLNNNKQEIPEEYALKLDAKDFACRSKAKAKPQRRELAGTSPRTIPIGKRIWTDVEPGEYSLSDYDISKKLIHLRRHGKQLHREDDGAVKFWRTKDNLQKHFPCCPHWSDNKWKKSMAGGGGNKKRYQYCTDSSGIIVYFRALQGHSGRSLVDPSLQDNVVIPSNFFKYIYHVGCAISLHSIINSRLIPGGQNLNNRQTVFFLLVDPMDKNHKDPDTIDLNEPRHAQYKHKAVKRHQNAVYWVDINLALKKGLKFYQTRSNEITLHETLPAYCISKVVRLKTGEVIYEKVYMSLRPPPKISLKHDWKRELGSEDAQRPEGQVVQQSRSFQSNQPIPNPSHDRTGQPVVRTDRTGQPGVETGRTQTRSSDDSKSLNVEMAHDRTGPPVVETYTENVPEGSQTRSCHESISFNVGDETIRDRTGQPVVNHDESSHEQTMLNEVNMNFRIPGLPHSVVKHAQSTSVRELIQKIENHSDRHALQQDLRQNNAYNPFSAESKRMIQDVGNVELFELFKTDTKTQCKACLSYWSEGIVYCTCGHLLKRNSGQSTFHCKNDGPSLNSRIRNQEGKTSWPQIWETSENKECHLAHNLKKRCEKRDY